MPTPRIRRFFPLLSLFAAGLLLMTGCKGDQKQQNQAGKEGQDTAAAAKLSLEPVSFKQFPDAQLSLKAPALDNLQPATTAFEFAVQNYELGAQTPDKTQFGIANSAKGQHIHLILNNDPYSAHYKPVAKKELPAGHHVLLAFLSRSYHASLKHKGAAVLKDFTVGPATEETKAADEAFDPEAPHLFYSRPKGDYTIQGERGDILLDFYLANVELSPDGYTVKATIGGQTFTIGAWKPHLIQNVPAGEHSIKLVLEDADGQPVESPFNPVTRTISVTSEQPAS